MINLINSFREGIDWIDCYTSTGIWIKTIVTLWCLGLFCRFVVVVWPLSRIGQNCCRLGTGDIKKRFFGLQIIIMKIIFSYETQRQHNPVRLATSGSVSSSRIQAPIYGNSLKLPISRTVDQTR